MQGIGDFVLAYQCLRLAVSADNAHSEAHNNLAVLELRRGEIERAKALFRAAADLNPQSYEPHFNMASLCHSVSGLQNVAFWCGWIVLLCHGCLVFVVVCLDGVVMLWLLSVCCCVSVWCSYAVADYCLLHCGCLVFVVLWMDCVVLLWLLRVCCTLAGWCFLWCLLRCG